MKASLLNLLAFLLVSPVLAGAEGAFTYQVRQANGALEYYQLVVPPNTQLKKADASEYATQSASRDKFSQQEAIFVAVAWAGGAYPSVKSAPSNSLTDVGGKPGGFYNATNVKPVSAEYHTSPVAYYLVQMTGDVGGQRQPLYAAVLEDGRVVRPVAGTPSAATEKSAKHHRHAKH